MKRENFDIAVIGAGASGLMAALTAKQHTNGSVIAIERLSRVGKKILSTGNGRCNLSNISVNENFYGGEKNFLNFLDKNIFSAVELFSTMSLACKTDSEGRIYPYSNQASSVLDALRFAVSNAGVELLCDTLIKDIKKTKSGFILAADDTEIFAKRVIIACGGKAAPSMGTDGIGYELAKALGHSVTRLYPCLAPLRTDVNSVKALKGLRIYARASLIQNGEIKDSQTGDVQFTDGAISGICIFNMSDMASLGKNEISLDIAPDYDKKQLFDMIYNARALRENLEAGELLTGLFHKRFSQSILKACNISPGIICGEISDKDISVICKKIKDWRFNVTGLSDWSLAQVTGGGIPLCEIKDGLQSAICDGLYFCGEILNIQGKCGGYNLDWAWKSGYTAGKNAALSLN